MHANHVQMAIHALLVLQDLSVYNVSTTVDLVTVVIVILQQAIVRIIAKPMSISNWMAWLQDVKNVQITVPDAIRLHIALSVDQENGELYVIMTAQLTVTSVLQLQHALSVN